MVYLQTKEQMEKSIEALRRDYKTLRTGKVNVNILDNIKVLHSSLNFVSI